MRSNSPLSPSVHKANVLAMLNNKKPEHPPDMYYIRRNPEMLERFLNDEHRMLRDFIQDSDDKNKRFYSIFKVSRED